MYAKNDKRQKMIEAIKKENDVYKQKKRMLRKGRYIKNQGKGDFQILVEERLR